MKSVFLQKNMWEEFEFKYQLKDMLQPDPILPFPQTQIPLGCYSYIFLSEKKKKGQGAVKGRRDGSDQTTN